MQVKSNLIGNELEHWKLEKLLVSTKNKLHNMHPVHLEQDPLEIIGVLALESLIKVEQVRRLLIFFG